MYSQPPIILYVEDDPGSQEVVEMTAMVMADWHLTIFDDSENFIERVAELRPRPNVFLLDIHVKPHTGLEMLRMLRADARFSDLPIIALTASVMNEEVAHLRSMGFDSVVAKPLDIDTFPEVVHRVLAGETVW